MSDDSEGKWGAIATVWLILVCIAIGIAIAIYTGVTG
jgi:hypothetical protein